jgi:hypothetical protein
MRRLFPNAGADEKPGIFFTWPYVYIQFIETTAHRE